MVIALIRSAERCDSKSLAQLEIVIVSEDYPLMTVGELARALGVPREFIFVHDHELGAIQPRDCDGEVPPFDDCLRRVVDEVAQKGLVVD